jgi:hypothetical protein
MSRRKRTAPTAPAPKTPQIHAGGIRRTPAQKEAMARLNIRRQQRDDVIVELMRRFFIIAATQADKRAEEARIVGGPICPHCGTAHNAPVKSLEGTPGSGVPGGGMIDLMGWGIADRGR